MGSYVHTALLTSCLAGALAAPLLSQSYQGGIRGLATDPQGAAVASARVTLTDQATSIARTTLTNESGQYVFSAVEPATYTVTVAAPGFEAVRRESISVGPQQLVTIDFHLSVGSVPQEIEVRAEAPLIDQADAANNATLATRQLEDLPVPGRNPYVMSKLESNVVATGTPSGSVRFADQTGVSWVAINGAPIASNNYLIDGVPTTDLNNRPVIVPSLEATAEMTLQRNSYDAEIGRTGGSTFTAVLKSGTDTLHGTLYGLIRQTNWTANPFFYTPGSPLNTDFYDYAGAIGGPMVIPRLYNGRHKTFFFLAEEGYRQRVPVTGSFYVPTALERTGDFSQSTQAIYNAFAGFVTCSGNSTQMCRQPFPGNRIPSSLTNPVGLAIAASYPLPNQKVTKYGAIDFANTVVELKRADNFSGKLDQQFFPWWAASVSYMHFGSDDPSASALGIAQAGTALLRKVDAVSQHNTFSISPTTVLTVGYGFNRFPNSSISFTEGFNQGELGFPSAYARALQPARFPLISMQTAASLGANPPTGVAGNSVFYSRSLVVGLAKSMGRHSLSLGYDFRSLSVDFLDTSLGSGLFSFTNLFSEQLPNAGTTASGADIADLLLGTPASGQLSLTSPLQFNVHYQAAYIQDAMRLSRRLTLTAGLRYEHEQGARERNNRMAVGFNRTAANPISATAGVNTLGTVEFAGQDGYPDHCCDNSDRKFAPRIGIAYSPASDLTLRAGYGIFYPPLFYANSALLAPGYTQNNSYVASNDGNVTPANTLSNPFPAGLQAPSGNALGDLTGIGNALTVLDQYRRSPFVQQYSMDVQRSFAGRIIVEAGYTGSKGRNLQSSSIALGSYNIDQLPDQFLTLGAQLLNKVANRYYGHGGTGVIGSATVAYNQLLRPFPEFSSVSIATTSASSLFNALNLRLEKQFSGGVSLVAAYTWSSNWDSAWGTTSSLNSGPSAPQDAYNLRAEYARAINDIPNRLSIGALAELPFGRGKRWMNSNRWLNLIAGGWQVNAIILAQNGAPLAVYQNTNNNASIGAGVQRPNIIGAACYSGSPESRTNSYLNASAFSLAPAFTYGDVARTISCHGPGLHNWDASVYKTFRLERFSFQFRAEALNAFNTPQFAAPNTAFASPTFGRILNTVNLPRYVQLGGKVWF
jgi:hypothetical protein